MLWGRGEGEGEGGGYKKKKIGEVRNKFLSKNLKQRNVVKLVARKSMVASVNTVNLVTKLTTANTGALLSTEFVSYSLQLGGKKL